MTTIFAVLFTLLQSAVNPSLLLTPDAPEMNRRAPDAFHVRMETTKGNFVIEIHREWSPNGVDHFYNLVRAGYYDQSHLNRDVREFAGTTPGQLMESLLPDGGGFAV